MALTFPLTPILDTATRANENPLSDGGSWTTITADLQLSSNKIVGTQVIAVNNNAMNWNKFTLSGNYGECFATIATKGSVTNDIVDIIIANSGTLNGYFVEYKENTVGVDTITLQRIDGGSGTILATFNQEVASGDSIGIQAVNGTYFAWYKSGAGAWTLLGSVSDATYSVSGASCALLLGYATTSQGITNFGGGEIKVVSPSPFSLTLNQPSIVKVCSKLPSPLSGTLVLIPPSFNKTIIVSPITLSLVLPSQGYGPVISKNALSLTTSLQGINKTILFPLSPLTASLSLVSPNIQASLNATVVVSPLSLTATLAQPGLDASVGFPTTPILDNFNRANEGPPIGGNWGVFQGGFKLLNNQIQGTTPGGTPDIQYYTAVTLTANQEAYLTVVSMGASTNDETGVILRADTTLGNGYAVEPRTGVGIVIVRIDGGTDTILATFPMTVNPGDSIGGRIVGNKISAFYKSKNGSWQLLGSAIDSTYSNIGVIAIPFGFVSTSAVVDNFGGGGLTIINVNPLILTLTPVAPNVQTSGGGTTVNVSPLSLSISLVPSNPVVNIAVSTLSALLALQTSTRIVNATPNALAATLALPISNPMVINVPGALPITLLLNPATTNGGSANKTISVSALSLSIIVVGVSPQAAVNPNALSAQMSQPGVILNTTFSPNALAIAAALGIPAKEVKSIVGSLSLSSLLGGVTPQSIVKANALNLNFFLTIPAISLVFNTTVIVAPLNLTLSLGLANTVSVYRAIRIATRNQQPKNVNKINALRRISRANAVKNQTHSGL